MHVKSLIQIWRMVSAQKMIHAIIVIIIRLNMPSFATQAARFELEA